MISLGIPPDVFKSSGDAFEGDALVTPSLRWSWSKLASRVYGLMNVLQIRGVGPGARVALRASNRPETVVALLAIAELGACAVLIHPRWTAAESEVLLREVPTELALDDDELLALLDRCVPARGSGVYGPLDPESPLAIVFTSGSSGRPKGAVLPRRAFAASALASAANLGWTADDRWLLTLPLCHVGGLSVVMRCLVMRKPMVLLPRFDPEATLDAIVRHRTTLVSVVPTMLRALLDADRDGALRLPRAVLVGGAAFPLPLREECAAAGVRALATYGLTEACSQVATESPDPSGRPLPPTDGVGRPLDGVELRVVDERGEARPPGEVGRIELRGPQLMTGYYGAPPLGDAWFDTGDLGSLDDTGVLSLRGRRTDLIVTGGENVYPAEVEAALLASPEVRAAMVFGVDDPRWGQTVAAALVLDAGDVNAALARVGAALVTKLSRYKLPRRVCVLDALPLLPNGKPDRAGAPTALGPLVREWTWG